MRPRSLFSPIFKGLLFAWTLWTCMPNLKFVALPVPEIIGGTQKNSAVPGYSHARSLFSPIFKGLLFAWMLWIHLPNLNFVALPVPAIIGVLKKIGRIWIPHAPFGLFSKIVHGLVFGWTLWMYRPNLQSAALAVPEIIAIAVLGWDCAPQSWRRGSGMVPFERTFATFYRLSLVTFPLPLRVSEILSLLCSSTPLFPTSPLVSPKFPHVPLRVGGWLLGYQERRCWANCSCN